LIKGSVALQIRSFALNLTQLIVARVIQSIDDEGVAPAAHALALQMSQLGGILLAALGMATHTLVPSAMATRKSGESSGALQVGVDVKKLVGRLLRWGVSLGLVVSMIQLVFLPNILSSSPLLEVRAAAQLPALISISLHALNAVVNIGEGTMMGAGSFEWLSANIVAATLGYLALLQILPRKFGISGVWLSMASFTSVRLLGCVAFFVSKMRAPEEPALQTL
jgi:Na+-driven multidrug efflux pump